MVSYGSLWGWGGGALSAAQLLPQMWRIYRVRSGTQISRWSVLLRVVSYALYLVHARLIGDGPLFWMTLVGLVLLLVVACQIAWYDYMSSNKKSITESIPPGVGPPVLHNAAHSSSSFSE